MTYTVSSGMLKSTIPYHSFYCWLINMLMMLIVSAILLMLLIVSVRLLMWMSYCWCCCWWCWPVFIWRQQSGPRVFTQQTTTTWAQLSWRQTQVHVPFTYSLLFTYLYLDVWNCTHHYISPHRHHVVQVDRCAAPWLMAISDLHSVIIIIIIIIIITHFYSAVRS